MRVIVVRHHAEDSPGFIAEAFAARGAQVTTHLFPADGPLPVLDGADHVVVLGEVGMHLDECLGHRLAQSCNAPGLRSALVVLQHPPGGEVHRVRRVDVVDSGAMFDGKEPRAPVRRGELQPAAARAPPLRDRRDAAGRCGRVRDVLAASR